MLKKFYSALLLTAFLLTAQSSLAQGFWVDDEGNEWTVTEGTKMGQNEGAEAACDGDVNTKLGTGDYPNYIVLEAWNEASVIGYTITTANDNASYPGRNPKNWKVFGSVDGNSWFVIDEVLADRTMQDENFTEYYFSCQASVKVNYVKFQVDASWGGGFMQYSEFHPIAVTHDHEWVKGETVAPDCVHEGYTVYTCSKCDGYKHDDITPATGVHNYGEDGLCVVCGDSNDAPAIVDGYMQLTSVKDFLYFADRVNAGYNYNAKLTTDLDLTGVEFTPIALTSAKPYSGNFDGQNHYIKGLTYNNPEKDAVGLFSIANGGEIKNLVLVDAMIVGNANAGGVIGRAYGTVIENVAVLNSYIAGRDHVGAIAGDLNTLVDEEGNATGATIRNTFSDSNIYSRQYQAGGLVGTANGGLMEYNVFSGIVQAAQSNAGGIVSLLDSDNNLTTLHANVSLASHIYGNGAYRIMPTFSRACEMYDNYALETTVLADVNGKNGGYLESFDSTDINGENIEADEARSKAFYEDLGFDFSVWKFFAGTEGKAYPVLANVRTPMTTVIYDLPDNPSLIWNNGDENIDLNVVHASHGQIVTFEVLTDQDKVDYDEDDNLLYVGGADGKYHGSGNPTIKAVIDPSVMSNYVLDGEDTFSVYVGNQNDVTEISTVEDMQLMLRNMKGKYQLVNDIDMAGVNYPGIGTAADPFAGEFDGAGHVISNLTINDKTRNQMGFFNVTNGATIKNVGVNNIDIEGETYSGAGAQVGSLIGECQSTTIENVAICGKVSARDHVGGFIGRTSGATTIKNCYSSVNVTGYSQVGGITGTTNKGDITFENVYYAGILDIYFRGWAGGMIGLIDQDETTITMTGCVSIGDLTSSLGDGADVNAVSPFIGGNGAYNQEPDGGKAVINFWNNVYNTDARLDGNTQYRWPEYGLTAEGGDVEDPMGASVGQLQKADIYKQIGWDFDNVWTIGADKDWAFPTLRCLPTFKTVDGIETVKTSTVKGNGAIYNIAGQKVDDSYRGIIIKDGKKFMVK